MWAAPNGSHHVILTDQIANLQNLTVPELDAEYRRLFGRPPRRRHPAYMAKRIGFKLQENANGGLTGPARAELERLASELHLPDAPPQRRVADDEARGSTGRPRPGTVLQRNWHDRQIRVEVTADGFLFDGEHFASLSAIAKRVTGQHWSGPRFFNLVGRSSK
jgi:hypothetical protein